MSSPTLDQRIGAAILDDDLVSEALDAYAAEYGCDLPTCAVHLVKLALTRPDIGYLGTRQVTEFVATPKLEKLRAGLAPQPAAPVVAEQKAGETVIPFPKAPRRARREAPTV